LGAGPELVRIPGRARLSWAVDLLTLKAIVEGTRVASLL